MGTTASGIVYPESSDNAEIWTHFQTMANSIQAILDASYQTTMSTYVPVVANAGTATWSIITGAYKYVGPKMVFVNIFLGASGAGSGSSNITVTTPTNPDRTRRQTLLCTTEHLDAASRLGIGTLVSFTSGSGDVWDRLRCTDGTTGPATYNVTGARILSTSFINIQGVYQEA